MEYLDVLDEEGKPIGIRKLRDEVHRDGDWHACVHVWLINSSNKLLLQERSANVRTYPGLWAYTAGGHVLAGETKEAALIREMKEEMGLGVSIEEIKLAFKAKNQDIEKNNQIDFVFIVSKEVDITKLILDPQEVERVE